MADPDRSPLDIAAHSQTEVVQAVSDAALLRLRAELLRAGTSTLSIVVDPTLSDPLQASAEVDRALKDGLASRHPLTGIHDNFARDRAPYLLHVHDESRAERCVNESVHTAVCEAVGAYGAEYKGRSVCGWVIGELDAPSLAQRLSSMARVVRPDRSLWPLRYWDPRVIWHMPRVLQQRQLQAMLAILGRWRYLDTSNALVAFADDTPGGEPSEIPLAFDAAGWAALTRIGTINLVIDSARDWNIRPTPANAKRIDALIQRCHALGFRTEQDELAFCACGLTSRDDFDTHPTVSEALRVGALRGFSLMQTLQTFDDDFWSDLRRQDSGPFI